MYPTQYSSVSFRIVPQILLVADSAFLKAFAQCIHGQRDDLIAGDPGQVPLVASMVTDLLSTSIARLAIYTPEEEEKHAWHTPPKVVQTPLPQITQALEACYDLDNAPLAGSVLSRALDPTFTAARYVKAVLLPLATQLIMFCSRRGISLMAEPFSGAIRKMIYAWEERVLGPKPQRWALAKEHENTLKSVTCTCKECAAVVQFLASDQGRDHSLYGIGARTRSHVESSLIPLRGIASSALIDSRPQGLRVSGSYHQRIALSQPHRRNYVGYEAGVGFSQQTLDPHRAGRI